jgi:hypothetical protein
MRSCADEVLAFAITRALRIILALLLQAAAFLIEGIAEVSARANALDLVVDTAATGVLATSIWQGAGFEASATAPGCRIGTAHLRAGGTVLVLFALFFGDTYASAAATNVDASGAIGVGAALGHANAASCAHLAVQAVSDAGATS